MKKVFVLGINGSPHKDGTTAPLVKNFLSSAKKYGAETELVNLVEQKINPCLGCYSKSPSLCKFPCVQKDDMQKLFPLLKKADAIVFASPIYWFNMSGLMKNFMDRCCSLAAHGYELEGKVGVYIAASKENEGGRMTAAMAMASTMNHLGLMVPPYCMMFYPGKEKVVKKGKVVWDDWISGEMPRVAKSIIPLCNFLRKSKLEW